MNTLPIIIEDNRVTIRRTKDGVWLSEHEVARLFEVFVSAVGSDVQWMWRISRKNLDRG